jgi:CubicO group peptidase (beta-lactamase class C family)
MWTPMHLRDGTVTSYGLGWGVETDPQGRRRISHTGGSIGGISILALYPDQRVVVAITVNTDKGLNALAGRVASWYMVEGSRP